MEFKVSVTNKFVGNETYIAITLKSIESNGKETVNNFWFNKSPDYDRDCYWYEYAPGKYGPMGSGTFNYLIDVYELDEIENIKGLVQQALVKYFDENSER